MHIPHGYPVNLQQQMERVGGAPPTVSAGHGKPSGPAGGFAIADQVDLSEAAKQFLGATDDCCGCGNSAQSAAHQARAMIAGNAQLASMPFGQVVAQLIHGMLNLTPPAEGDGGAAGDTAAVAAADGLSELPAVDGEVAALVDGEGAGFVSPPTAEAGTETASDGIGEPVIQPLPENGGEAAAAVDGAEATGTPDPATDGSDTVAEDSGATDGGAVADGAVTEGDGAGDGLSLPVEPPVSADMTAMLLDMLNGGDGSEAQQAA